MEINFDPKEFNPPLDQDGDGIYHFTTITVAEGVTVKFREDRLNGPVYWLATGDVQIDGILDLNGENGLFQGIKNASMRIPSVAGAGGFSGGLGSVFGISGSGNSTRTSGKGPGAGQISFRGGGGTGYVHQSTDSSNTGSNSCLSNVVVVGGGTYSNLW